MSGSDPLEAKRKFESAKQAFNEQLQQLKDKADNDKPLVDKTNDPQGANDYAVLQSVIKNAEKPIETKPQAYKGSRYKEDIENFLRAKTELTSAKKEFQKMLNGLRVEKSRLEKRIAATSGHPGYEKSLADIKDQIETLDPSLLTRVRSQVSKAWNRLTTPSKPAAAPKSLAEKRAPQAPATPPPPAPAARAASAPPLTPPPLLSSIPESERNKSTPESEARMKETATWAKNRDAALKANALEGKFTINADGSRANQYMSKQPAVAPKPPLVSQGASGSRPQQSGKSQAAVGQWIGKRFNSEGNIVKTPSQQQGKPQRTGLDDMPPPPSSGPGVGPK